MVTLRRAGRPTLAACFGVLVALSAIVGSHAPSTSAQASSGGYAYTIFVVAGSQNVGANGNVAPGSDVGVHGAICPSPNIGVGEGIGGNVTYVRPDGTSYTDTNIDITSSNFDYCGGGYEGSAYVDGFTPTMQGTWHVYAYAWWQWFNGTEVVLQSNEMTFNVGPPGPDWTTIVYAVAVIAVLAVVGAAAFLIYRSRHVATSLPPPPPP